MPIIAINQLHKPLPGIGGWPQGSTSCSCGQPRVGW